MEVGSLRERIIVALLIYKFGEHNVISNIPITESEVDVILYDKPVSIKTLTSKGLGGVKLIWTVDALKAIEFRDTYNPHCDMLLIQLNWNSLGVLCYIPFEAQVQIFESIGRKNYIKLPKEGTNPRGVEITQDALLKLVKHEESKNIEIFWQKTKIDYDPFKRWIDYWKED